LNSLVNLSNNSTNRTTTRNNDLSPLYNSLLNSFLNPVSVVPTQQQINNAVQIIKFGDIVNPKNSSCPISREDFLYDENVSIIRHCKHVFKTEELNTLFTTSCYCPVCRFDIRETII
jgi:hypothetical protein